MRNRLKKALLELREKAWTYDQKDKIKAVLKLLETDFKDLKSKKQSREFKNYIAECENCQHSFIINKDELLENSCNEFRSNLYCPVCESFIFSLEKIERKNQLKIENKSILNYLKKERVLK